MKFKIEVDEKEIKEIIADFFGVEASKVRIDMVEAYDGCGYPNGYNAQAIITSDKPIPFLGKIE